MNRNTFSDNIMHEDITEIEADNARWDALFATLESQELLEKLAEEALAEHRAEKTRPMVFDEKGRIRSG